MQVQQFKLQLPEKTFFSSLRLAGITSPGHVQGQDACMSERAAPALPDQIPTREKEESTEGAHKQLLRSCLNFKPQKSGVVGVGRGKRYVCRWSGAQNTER